MKDDSEVQDAGRGAGPGKTALVLCGGGGRGAAEIGFYRALVELGIEIDFIVGTSVGAINGAFIGAGVPLEDLRRLWLEFPNWKPFRFNWSLLWRLHLEDGLLDPADAENLEENSDLQRIGFRTGGPEGVSASG